jgi:hypothetical protein
MADCDLCGRSEPTLIPVRVKVPTYSYVYPEGMWRNLCERCLELCAETERRMDKKIVEGKCNLSLVEGDVVEVEIEIPSFSKGVRREKMYIAPDVLKECARVYDRYKKGTLPPFGEF